MERKDLAMEKNPEASSLGKASSKCKAPRPETRLPETQSLSSWSTINRMRGTGRGIREGSMTGERGLCRIPKSKGLQMRALSKCVLRPTTLLNLHFRCWWKEKDEPSKVQARLQSRKEIRVSQIRVVAVKMERCGQILSRFHRKSYKNCWWFTDGEGWGEKNKR